MPNRSVLLSLRLSFRENNLTCHVEYVFAHPRIERMKIGKVNIRKVFASIGFTETERQSQAGLYLVFQESGAQSPILLVLCFNRLMSCCLMGQPM